MTKDLKNAIFNSTEWYNFKIKICKMLKSVEICD